MQNMVIPMDLIDQDNVYAMVVYATFQTVLNYGNGNKTISPDWIGDQLDYECPLGRNEKLKINNALKYLAKLGYLIKEDTHFKVDTDLFYNYETYVNCDRFIFDELCCAPKLFRHYLILKDCGGEDFSLEYYANREGTSTRTITRYNRDLESLGLIKTRTATYNPASGKRVGNNTYTVLN